MPQDIHEDFPDLDTILDQADRARAADLRRKAQDTAADARTRPSTPPRTAARQRRFHVVLDMARWKLGLLVAVLFVVLPAAIGIVAARQVLRPRDVAEVATVPSANSSPSVIAASASATGAAVEPAMDASAMGGAGGEPRASAATTASSAPSGSVNAKPSPKSKLPKGVSTGAPSAQPASTPTLQPANEPPGPAPMYGDPKF